MQRIHEDEWLAEAQMPNPQDVDVEVIDGEDCDELYDYDPAVGAKMVDGLF